MKLDRKRMERDQIPGCHNVVHEITSSKTGGKRENFEPLAALQRGPVDAGVLPLWGLGWPREANW